MVLLTEYNLHWLLLLLFKGECSCSIHYTKMEFSYLCGPNQVFFATPSPCSSVATDGALKLRIEPPTHSSSTGGTQEIKSPCLWPNPIYAN